MNLVNNKRVIYEDDDIIVIMQDVPNSNGEVILMTKKNLSSLFDVDNALLVHIHEVLKKIKDLLYDRLSPEGLKIMNDYSKDNIDDRFFIKIIPYYKPQQPLVDVDIIYDKLK